MCFFFLYFQTKFNKYSCIEPIPGIIYSHFTESFCFLFSKQRHALLSQYQALEYILAVQLCVNRKPSFQCLHVLSIGPIVEVGSVSWLANEIRWCHVNPFRSFAFHICCQRKWKCNQFVLATMASYSQSLTHIHILR